MGDKLLVILNNDNWLRAKKGFVVVRRRNPSTGLMGWMPLRSRSRRPIYVAMGEPDWYPTKVDAVKATHKYR